MDVNVTSTVYNPVYASQNSNAVSTEKSSSIDSGIRNKIEEKTMMDLRDVQNFLYMLIGSELRVESDTTASGCIVNKTA